jgi:hypothetical protein
VFSMLHVPWCKWTVQLHVNSSCLQCTGLQKLPPGDC